MERYTVIMTTGDYEAYFSTQERACDFGTQYNRLAAQQRSFKDRRQFIIAIIADNGQSSYGMQPGGMLGCTNRQDHTE